MKLSDEYRYKSLRELSAWNWAPREPSEIELHSANGYRPIKR